MSNFEPNAVIRGFQLTVVGSECPTSLYFGPQKSHEHWTVGIASGIEDMQNRLSGWTVQAPEGLRICVSAGSKLSS